MNWLVTVFYKIRIIQFIRENEYMKNKLQMLLLLFTFFVCFAGCGEVLSETDDSSVTEEPKEIVYVKAPLSNDECISSSYAYIEREFTDAGFEIVWPLTYQVEYGHSEYDEGDIVKVEIQDEKVEKEKEYDSSAVVFVYIADQPFAREIVFGKYKQSNTSSKEPISWYVVATEGDKCLLVSKDILDYQPFNDTLTAQSTTWEESTLREWLNETFYEEAFSTEEQRSIRTTTVQDYEADGKLGGKTKDKVFLLNYEEAWKYFPTDADRQAELTVYGQAQKKISGNSWWLINSYSNGLHKYVVNEEGLHENSPRVNESEGVRPAIWVGEEVINGEK